MSAGTAMDTQAWTWIDPDGVEHDFAEVNGIIPGLSQGTGMPPTRRSSIRVPGRSGAFTLDRNYGERSWALQVMLDVGDAESLDEAIAAWARRFNVLRGGGTIRRTRADGVTSRVLYCDYDDGFGIDQGAAIGRQGVQAAVLTFLADDPFWYDEAETVEPFTAGGGVTFFPIPNPITGSFITLSSSEVFGTTTIDNDGDTPAFPVWTITGPGTDIALTNTTTGEVLALTDDGGLDLLAGDVLTIDTRPGTTRLEVDGVNVANYLTDASTLWPLALGSNTITVSMAGASGASEVSLAYRRGWLTP